MLTDRQEVALRLLVAGMTTQSFNPFETQKNLKVYVEIADTFLKETATEKPKEGIQ